MPEMQIARSGSKPCVHGPSLLKNAFTGDAYINPVHAAEGLNVSNVNFTPCARTYWHTHGGGQLLTVLAGSGWVCDKGAKPVKIMAGDVVWCPPGTTHWHGADEESYMVHQALSLGDVEWLDAVNEEEYSKRDSK
jgi:quercetin dioxygenase-like cupin family protein